MAALARRHGQPKRRALADADAGHQRSVLPAVLGEHGGGAWDLENRKRERALPIDGEAGLTPVEHVPDDDAARGGAKAQLAPERRVALDDQDGPSFGPPEPLGWGNGRISNDEDAGVRRGGKAGCVGTQTDRVQDRGPGTGVVAGDVVGECGGARGCRENQGKNL